MFEMSKCTISVLTNRVTKIRPTNDYEKRAAMKREYRFNIYLFQEWTTLDRVNYIRVYLFPSDHYLFSPPFILDIPRFLDGNLLGVHFSSFSTDFPPIKGYSAVCGKVAGRTIKVIPIIHPARYCFVNVARHTSRRNLYTRKYTHISVLHSHVCHLALLAIRRIFRRDHIWDREVVSQNPQCNHIRSSSFLGCSEPRAQSICRKM